MPRRSARLVACATVLSAVFVPLLAQAEAMEAAVRSPTATVAELTSCSLGGLVGGGGSGIAQLLTFGNGGEMLGNAGLAIETAAFALVMCAVVLRTVVRGAREGIDGLLLTAFQNGTGPFLLFAAGTFLLGQLAHSSQDFTTNLLNHAVTLGQSAAVGNVTGPGYLIGPTKDLTTSLDLSGALNGTNYSNMVSAGLCVAQSVALGVPAGASGGTSLLNSIIATLTTVQIEMTDPFGWIEVALCVALQVLTAVFVMFVFVRLIFECFIVVIKKLFLLPIGLMFFAFGQFPFMDFLKNSYIRLVTLTFVEILILSVLAPVFTGVLLGTVGIFLNAIQTFSNGPARIVDAFVVIFGAALMNFFLGSYRSMAHDVVNGQSSMSGDGLRGAFSGALGATAGVISKQINSGFQVLAGTMGGPVAQRAMSGISDAFGAAAGSVGAGADATSGTATQAPSKAGPSTQNPGDALPAPRRPKVGV